MEDRFAPALVMVTSAADAGVGTLRDAITTANKSTSSVTIGFAIGAAGTAQTINLKTALPAISATVTIDGSSQGGSGYKGPALIELNGAQAGVFTNGLVLTCNNSTIDGLIIDHFAHDGILLKNVARGNTIGGTTVSTRNVISGNHNDGIEFAGFGVTNNTVQNNFIGTDTTGTIAMGNRFDGVLIRDGSAANSIGGTSAGTANIISGNGNDGIEMVNSGTNANLVEGNFIGTDLTGTLALANKFDGVLIRTGALSNTIGGTSSATANVISGNGNDGIEIVNTGTINNLVEGNFIGSDLTGTKAVANKFDGVLIRTGASSNTIGGTSPGTANIISGNGKDGIEIVNPGTTRNVIEGNTIGAQSDGVSALVNIGNGVAVRNQAANNVIGGTDDGAGNIIAFNGGNGVLIGFTTSGNSAGTGNAIEGNSIFSNNRLGIFLGFDNTSKAPVVLANNSKGHTGINNNYQNFPVLSTPTSDSGSTVLAGTLSSPNNPKQKFRIEFFSNSNTDLSGHGQGMVFLGAVTVTTNAAGKGSFSMTLPILLTSGEVVSATATDPLGNTSEFAKNVIVP